MTDPLVPDPYLRNILKTLHYPNPPAGFAAILVNGGEREPIVVHVDLAEPQREITFGDGRVVLTSAGQDHVLVGRQENLHDRPPPGPPGTAWARGDAETVLLIHENKKIQAIKRVRSGTHLGLKEAKDVVDYLCGEII